MKKPKISICRLALAFVVGLTIAVGIKFILHKMKSTQVPPSSVDPLAAQFADDAEAIDLRSALGIDADQLRAFLRDSVSEKGEQGYPLQVTLQNTEGDYLADSVVKLVWEQGEEILPIGSSGVLVLSLNENKLPRLRLMVPAGYTLFRQQTIPLGSAYQPMERPDTSNLKYDVIWDREIQDSLKRELYRFQSIEACPRGTTLRSQLRRTGTSLLLEASSGEELTPSEIFQKRKDSVVVVASLLPNGRITKGTGFVVHSSGVIAVAFHVIDKPHALAQVIMTASGEAYPVTEVLAARRSADVALVKTTGVNLSAAPLSEGDVEGTPVTLISHPDERFFSLTQGYICRYSASALFGETVVRMTITAEFADGSSGAPVFNSRGEVTGLVSFTSGPGKQMVHRSATPVAEIRRLVRAPAHSDVAEPSQNR